MIDLEFKECDTCRAKTGMPVLCSGCLHNRKVIDLLTQNINSKKFTIVINPESFDKND